MSPVTESTRSPHRRLRRPSPPMVVALVALFTAIAGPALASHGGPHVPNIVNSIDVQNNSLTGKDIKDKSLTKKDFRGSVRGPRGRTGAQGAQGAQGGQGAQGIQGPPGNPSTAGRVGSALGANGSFGGAAHLPVAAVTLTVPSDATRVNVSGGVSLSAAVATNFAIRFTQDNATCGSTSPAYFDRVQSSADQASVFGNQVFPVGPGVHTYRLCLATGGAADYFQPHIVAETEAAGSTGLLPQPMVPSSNPATVR